MRRVLFILGLLALAIPGQAQRGMRAAPMGRPAPVFRGAPAPRFVPMPRFAPMPRGPMVRFTPGTRVFRRGFGPSGFTFGHIGHGGVRFRTFPFCDPSFVSCQFQLSRFGFSPFLSPFGFGGFGFGAFPFWGGSPIFWDTNQPDYSQAVAQPALQPIVIYAQPPQQQQPAPPPEPAPQPQAAPGKQPEPMSLPATILVFRDQHREEVANYAIAGDTLFLFVAGGRKKIPISELDLPATIKVNDDRGVEFHVPHKGS